MRLASLVDEFRDWRDRRAAAADLRRLNKVAEVQKVNEIPGLVEAVRNAAAIGDPDGAEKAFLVLRARAPNAAASSVTALRSLLTAGKIELAEAAIEQGLRKFPGSRDLMRLHADAARRRHDKAESRRRWNAVRSRFPTDGWAWFWEAEALTEAGEYQAADKAAARAAELNPDSSQFLFLHATIAERLSDWPEALRRWETMRGTVKDPTGWVEGARLLAEMGRDDEAAELLKTARWQFPGSPAPLVGLAEMCQRCGPPEEAVGHWATIRTQFPFLEKAYVMGARALRELDRYDEADAVLQRYADRLDATPFGLAEWARSMQKHDPREAARRWAVVRGKFPARKDSYMMGAAALEAIGERDEAARLRAAWVG